MLPSHRPWRGLTRRLTGGVGGLASLVGGWLAAGLSLSAASPPPAAPGKNEVSCSGDTCWLGACPTQALLADPMGSLSSLRAIPQMEGGAVVGFKLFGLVPGTLAARLGVQNGDVVTALNGNSLATPEAALSAFTAARDAKEIRIGLLHAGQPSERRLILDRRPVPAGECPALPKPVASPGKGPAPTATAGDWARDIVCRGTRCVLKNGVLDRVLADQDQLLRSVRLVPMRVDGQQRGYKLFAIRPGSVCAALGLQNGDVVEQLAGEPLNSPENALTAYSKLRSQPSIPVAILRRGTPLTLTYDIERPPAKRPR